ncbi:MAG: hypothetical protein HY747_03535 [Elusimicrobia bacterium]|nr:hypothetical protein [Elusimicrobiota bacterium]
MTFKPLNFLLCFALAVGPVSADDNDDLVIIVPDSYLNPSSSPMWSGAIGGGSSLGAPPVLGLGAVLEPSGQSDDSSSWLGPIGLGALGIIGAIGLRQTGGRFRAFAPLVLGAGLLGAALTSTGCEPIDPAVNVCDGELDIRNGAYLETMAVYVDGVYVASIEPGHTKGLLMYEGVHNVDIYESFSGDLLVSRSIAVVCGGLDAWEVYDPYESELDVDNQTAGYVNIGVDGDYFEPEPPGNWAYPIREGSHRLELSDYEDGELFYSSSAWFGRRLAYQYTVTDPVCAELDVYNGTGEQVSIVIDGYSYGYQPWGSIYGYYLSDDYHLVQAVGWSGWVYYNQTDYYYCGTYYLDLY